MSLSFSGLSDEAIEILLSSYGHILSRRGREYTQDWACSNGMNIDSTQSEEDVIAQIKEEIKTRNGKVLHPKPKQESQEEKNERDKQKRVDAYNQRKSKLNDNTKAGKKASKKVGKKASKKITKKITKKKK